MLMGSLWASEVNQWENTGLQALSVVLMCHHHLQRNIKLNPHKRKKKHNIIHIHVNCILHPLKEFLPYALWYTITDHVSFLSSSTEDFGSLKQIGVNVGGTYCLLTVVSGNLLQTDDFFPEHFICLVPLCEIRRKLLTACKSTLEWDLKGSSGVITNKSKYLINLRWRKYFYGWNCKEKNKTRKIPFSSKFSLTSFSYL